MHVPYALVGRQSDALRLLKEVSDIATQASPRDRVFSLVVYDYVPLADFIVFNQQMITAIEVKNELWDGAKLPQVEVEARGIKA